MFWWWVVCSFTFSTNFLATSQFFLQSSSCGPITRSAEAQPTDWSLASRPNCRHANDNRQQAVCFCGEFLISSPFLPLFLATSQFFLQLSSCGPITRSAEAQPTDWSLASCPHRRHANDNRQRRVCFYGELFVPSPFLPVFSYVSVIFLQLNNYCPITGSAVTQPTDWSLAFRSHRRHANDNRQQWVYFEDTFS
jgi:hypothetical protein